MKIPKIFVNGNRDKGLERDYEGRFTSFKRKWSRRVKSGFWVVMAIGWLGAAFEMGAIFNPVVQAQLIKEGTPPVLERIAKCESGNKHFDKNGQVLMRSNTNRSVDVGRYQINSVWFKKASELGLDITKEKDNEEMALWIYRNRGTGDWYSSQHCWKK